MKEQEGEDNVRPVKMQAWPEGHTDGPGSDILDAVSAHAAVLDWKGTIVKVNAAWRQFAVENGYGDASAGLGLNYLEVLEAASLPEAAPGSDLAEGIRRVLRGEIDRFTSEYPCHSAAQQRWFCATVSPLLLDGRTGALVAHLDVTSRVLAEQRVQVIDSAFAGSGEAIIICDEQLRIVDANPAYCALKRKRMQDIVGKRPAFLDDPHQSSAVQVGLATHGKWSGELLIPGKEGRPHATARASISSFSGPSAGKAHYIIWLTNVTRLRELEQTVDDLAYRDAITGLPNENAMKLWLDERIRADDGRPESVACVRILLERMRVVNEVYGYSAGDELLRELSRRLQRNTVQADFVARASGNEFVVLLCGVGSAEQAIAVATELLAKICQPIAVRGSMFTPSAMAGVSSWPSDASTGDELVRAAGAALADAKSRGLSRVVPFCSSLRGGMVEQLEIESALRLALARNEFHLHFQPAVELDGGKVLGFEALLRWKSQSLGLVPPGKFIPVAEESGLIIEISAWVLEEACRRLAQWTAAGRDDIKVAINLSPVEFLHCDVAKLIASALQRHGLSGERLQVEITEGILVRDPARTAEILKALRHLGVGVALDDFGTGYSSLSYLKRFPIQAIKLDRSFVMGMTPGSVDAHIVQSVIELAHRLGMESIAEGVEDAAHAELLRGWGCEQAQGYYFSMPIPADDVSWLLKQHPTLPVARAGLE